MRFAITVAIAIFSSTALGQDLPKQIAWTAYGTTSSGYAQSVGLGNMLKAKYDVDLRIIPGKNDVSRMLPLRANQVQVCACGIASYFAQEGVFMFADPKWGPVRMYNLFNNNGRNGQQVLVAGDAGVKTYADIRGKRVAWVKAAPAVNINTTAALAFGGLTWADVVKVEFPGWGQSLQGVIDGQVDVAATSTISSVNNQVAASPRGLFYPVLHHDDTAGWARAKAVAPFWSKTMVGVAIAGEMNATGKVPFEGNNYPYPLFVGLDHLSDDLAYALTKAVMENYETFKNAGPGMDGYQLANQNFNYVLPYHAGAIRYYKEAGVWSDAAQAAQDANLKRQDVLAAAWTEFTGLGVAGDAYETKWLEVRAKHLGAAGLAVPFAEPFPE